MAATVRERGDGGTEGGRVGLVCLRPRAIRRRMTGTGGASCLRRVGRILELDDAPYRMLMVRFNLA